MDQVEFTPSKTGGLERARPCLEADRAGLAFQGQHLLAVWPGTKDLTFLGFSCLKWGQ